MIRKSMEIVLLLVVILPDPAFGWWPIGHYEITKRAGLPDIAEYSQLPDYEDSWSPIVWTGPPEMFEVADISRYFCWSHAAQDAGEIAAGLVPIKPAYPDDGRYPCPDMWYVVQHKLGNLTPEQKIEMEKTARGFLAHNAADRVVHYAFFGGADPGDGLIEGKDKWLVEHSHKEKWADYWIYIRENWASDWEAAFDAEGKLELTVEYANGVPVATPTDDMAFMMQLSQKVSRKTRRFTEAGKDYYVISPQTISEIKQKVQNTINSKVTAEKLRSDYTRADFLDLEAEAVREGWLVPQVIAKYSEAQSNVLLWMNALAQ